MQITGTSPRMTEESLARLSSHSPRYASFGVNSVAILTKSKKINTMNLVSKFKPDSSGSNPA
ncbi:hypothetical protein AGR8A_Lc10471 [Agrobacterium fabrum str. J-07]|nr:hypothetical protein AGR8A_Lc10471 [Agrobacterium fabrum str. J-07]